MEGQVTGFVRDAPLSNHMVPFYETSEEKHDIIFAFVKAGLENQQSVIDVTDDDYREVLLSRLSQIGIKEKTKGLQILSGEEFYVEDGSLKNDMVVDKCRRTARHSTSRGYKGLGLTGEPTFFFRNDLMESSIVHERSLPKKFDFLMTSTCRYSLEDLRSYDEESLLPELIKIHSYTITPNSAGEIDFQEYHLRSAEQTLNSLLRKTAASTILNCLEIQCGLYRKTIPDKIEESEKELKKLFGDEISAMVCTQVLKVLYSNIGLKYHYDLTKVIESGIMTRMDLYRFDCYAFED